VAFLPLKSRRGLRFELEFGASNLGFVVLNLLLAFVKKNLNFAAGSNF